MKRRDYELMPSLAPILIAALLGLLLWLLAVDALAQQRVDLGAMLAPNPCGCEQQQQYQQEQRRNWREAQIRARRMEARQLDMERHQRLQRFRSYNY